MWIYSQRSVPLTAQRDIKVIKTVRKNDSGSFIAESQDFKLTPDKYMFVQDDEACEIYCGHEYCITNGYIQSAMSGNDLSLLFFKEMKYGIVSYIPKGTKYYIKSYMNGICSEKLLLTDEVMTWNELENYNFRNEITLPIAMDVLTTVDRKTVSPGWIVLSDRTFIHPLNYDVNKMTAIGIVCCIKNKRVLITALEQKELEWHHDFIDTINKPIVDKETALNDMNGRRRTKKITKTKIYKNDISSYKAVRYCVEYETEGTEKGEWYLPSTGELACMFFYDLDVINAVLTLLDKQKIHSYYWTSAEYSKMYAWFLDIDYENLRYEPKYNNYYVRPSFSLLVK